MSPLKQIGVLIVLGGLAAGGYYGWRYFGSESQAATQPSQRPAERAVTVETAPSGFRDIETVVEAVGSTRALRSVAITPLASGRITELTFRSGAAVPAGSVLMRLDDDIQRADLAEAEARVSDAASRLKRAETLKKSNTVTEATVDQITAELAIARADRDRAARRLRDRTVLAPFEGVVGFTDAALGARIEVGDVVTVLDDLSHVEIEFNLTEALFSTVRQGMRIVAGAAAFPGQKFEGTIESIDSRIDPISRSFAARALIDNSDGTLPAGMFMHIEVVLNSAPALSVPEAALVVDGSRAFIFVVSSKDGEMRVERRDVTVGRRSFGYVEMLDGVTDGDVVVIRGVQKVRDGTLVKSQAPNTGASDGGPSDTIGS